MSSLSGKCDLMDHIFGLGGLYNKDSKPVKFGDKNTTVYYSDLLQDFEAFKKQTGGVIYQHKKVDLQKWFRDDEFNFIKEHCKGFDYCIRPTEEGKLVKLTDYSFTYYDKQYDFKELKKKGIWITVPIHFNTLLDLLSYLSYIVSASCGGYVVLSSQSYVEEHRDEAICKFAHDSYMFDDYRKKLSDLYLSVCKNYFLYDLENRTKTVSIKTDEQRSGNIEFVKKTEEGNYLIKVDEPIDYMHDIDYVWDDTKTYVHWTSPKMIDEYTIELNKEDVEQYLKEDIKKGTVKIKYVVKPKDGFPIVLN